MREIGYDQPCYIIAEAGINHNGSLDIAKHMAEAALVAGADAVKYQTFLPTEINYPNITYAETEELKKFCDEIGIDFLSTPHSLSAVVFLRPFVPLYKIASPRLFDTGFMTFVLDQGIPLIVSINEKARHNDFGWLFTFRDTRYFLPKTITVYPMHTVCQYPANDPKFWQLGIRMHLYHDMVWGYSDHMVPDKNACVEAVDEYGVAIVEKHFKLVDDCPDSVHSLTAKQFKDMVTQIRQVEAAKIKTS